MLAKIFSDSRLLLLCVCIFLVIYLFLGILIGSVIQRLKDTSRIKKEREDAVKKSRAVLGGQFGEQIAPFLPKFPCNPGDVRFIGKPVDFIAFPGSAEGKTVTDVLFIEVKSGDSHLSNREKEIKNAIKAGRVHYVEYRLPQR